MKSSFISIMKIFTKFTEINVVFFFHFNFLRVLLIAYFILFHYSICIILLSYLMRLKYFQLLCSLNNDLLIILKVTFRVKFPLFLSLYLFTESILIFLTIDLTYSSFLISCDNRWLTRNI